MPAAAGLDLSVFVTHAAIFDSFLDVMRLTK
jgi:hypothetical protein